MHIAWLDAKDGKSEWMYPSDYEQQKAAPAQTVGWIVQEDAYCIVVAQCLAEEILHEEFQFGNTFIIPKGMIRKITVLPEP